MARLVDDLSDKAIDELVRSWIKLSDRAELARAVLITHTPEEREETLVAIVKELIGEGVLIVIEEEGRHDIVLSIPIETSGKPN